MKKVILATTAIIALAAGSAVAADLPVKAPAVMAAPACAQFGGFYIGAQAGAGYYDHRWEDRDGWAKNVDHQLPSSVSSTKTGVMGGVTGGYNMQNRCTVFGVEADYSWSGINNTVYATDGDTGLSFDALSVSSKLRGIGTVRARTGVVVDNLLLYVTGGFAWGNFKRSYTIFEGDLNEGGPASETLNTNKNKWGWVGGVGTEWAWGGGWSLKSEILYARFQKDTQTFATSLESSPTVIQSRFDHQDSVIISRIGINYRFGS